MEAKTLVCARSVVWSVTESYERVHEMLRADPRFLALTTIDGEQMFNVDHIVWIRPVR